MRFETPRRLTRQSCCSLAWANLRRHHIVILKLMIRNQPHPTKPDSFLYWGLDALAEKSSYGRDLVSICIAGLVQGGLISQVGDAYGVCYEITGFGRTALEVLDDL